MPRRLIDADLSSIVPSSKLWADGEVNRWINDIGDLEHMIGYGEIFWPDFIEHDGCILREGVDEENYQSWLKRLDGNKQAVESMINHVDLIYLFQANPDAIATDEQVTYLGRLLREMWQAKLTLKFPGHRLMVRLWDEPDGGPVITVYQPRDHKGRIEG